MTQKKLRRDQPLPGPPKDNPVPYPGLVLAGLIGFALLGWNYLKRGPLYALDERLNVQVHRHAVRQPRGRVRFLRFTSFYLGREVLILTSLAAAGWFLLRRRWREFWMVVIGVGGAGVWWKSLSLLFNRKRPQFEGGFEALPDPSFPSGHSMSSILAYGLFAYLYSHRLPTQRQKILTGVGTTLLILFITLGRLYVGGHYLTDILAGYSLALAWGSLVYPAIDPALRPRRPHRSSKHPFQSELA